MMNKDFQIIYITWEQYSHSWAHGYEKDLNDPSHKGLYQVYGNHPVYGKDVLLYIGKTLQTFEQRLNKHFDTDFCKIDVITRIHIGMIKKIFSAEKIGKEVCIDVAEDLLLAAHYPALNSSSIKQSLPDDMPNYLIINGGDFGQLLPEVSSLRYKQAPWIDFNESELL